MIPALTIKNLSKVYDNGFEALKGISLTVEQGDFYALLGPNGAGKSTTIGIVCSLVSKTDGQVQVFDADIDEDFPAAKKYIGIVPQEFNFNMFETAFDIVVNQGGYYGMPVKLARQRAEKYLKELGLWDKRAVATRTLSGGMKRRLMIARALVHQPKLLILDEPTAGVDIEMRRSMWDFLQKINAEGTTIILTTHYLEEAEALCRHIGIINHGEIVEDTSIRELLRRLQREVFILDSVEDLPEDLSLPGFVARRIDAHSMEVEVEKGQHINQVFAALDAQGIHVSSMRNRANRLEEMFVSLVEGAA
ncbi:ABC transporter, ATP-binding protein [marine gamma proteobacterium HTCC2148]|jgi:ABC-2 type transport system ATP-binding protein|uniref:ABC transporter ATP-binding protein n=1 Tax=Candidatus Seongchinamella marina TaxID=2518990 RepID=A0ABT3STH2_9GAMM|nr:ABC transporter ATP-binding protein [Candidatus Seongchinamella marina]EEB79645.1 ABC transporter, ATP-binding protein [marine gamma proteobacterium HTCC2148]MBT6125435.1 ABC transporter ATP-binding protein [Halieaceae bacterium]MCX2973286.1 ABC transporter ATP-binding protein [Candidatus Seongchinamella marina]